MPGGRSTLFHIQQAAQRVMTPTLERVWLDLEVALSMLSDRTRLHKAQVEARLSLRVIGNASVVCTHVWQHSPI